MSAYTPTTDQVREWALHGFGEYKDLGSDWFDRWLQQVKAEAWQQGHDAGYRACHWQHLAGNEGSDDPTDSEAINPYRTQDGK